MLWFDEKSIHSIQIKSKCCNGHLIFLKEPLEANNKFFKQFREHFARKCSREKNLRDVFTRTCASSDPLILNYYFKLKRNNRKRDPFDSDVLALLNPIAPDAMKWLMNLLYYYFLMKLLFMWVLMYFKIYFFSKLIGIVGTFHVFEKKI